MRNSILYIGVVLLTVISSNSVTAQQVSPRQLYDNVSGAVHREVYDDSVEITYRNQANTSDMRWRHNIRIGIGTSSFVATALIGDGLYDDHDYIVDHSLSNLLEREHYVEGPETQFPCLYAEYSYQLRPWLAIGGKTTFDAIWMAIYDVRTGLRVGNHDKYAISALANFRFDWLRRTNFQLYSSIGAGVAMRIEKGDNTLVPMYDATFIGISIGRGFYCFWEVGLGISGIARAGIGIRFNSKQR